MSEIAKQRWKLLAIILSKRRCRIGNSLLNVSVRRFSSFGILKIEKLLGDDLGKLCAVNSAKASQSGHTWFRYFCDAFPDYSPLIRHLDDSIELTDLLGFNHTGNVCVWPSEEILTYYCLHHDYLFRGKSVCELGGGMTCLAGVGVALCSEVKQVLLTDGNEQSVSNISEIIEQNRQHFKAEQVETRLLRWNEDYKDLLHQFDWIICADCLFFDEFHIDLLGTMLRLLKIGGESLIFAPSRGDTFNKFVNMVSRTENITVLMNTVKYDDYIWNLHSENVKLGIEFYEESLHYPRLLHLRKETGRKTQP